MSPLVTTPRGGTSAAAIRPAAEADAWAIPDLLTFTKEFKAQAVRIVRERSKVRSSGGARTGSHGGGATESHRQGEIDAGRDRVGVLTTDEREELGRPRCDDRTLRMEHDILEKRRSSSRRRMRERRVHRRGEGRFPRRQCAVWAACPALA